MRTDGRWERLQGGGELGAREVGPHTSGPEVLGRGIGSRGGRRRCWSHEVGVWDGWRHQWEGKLEWL